MPDVNISDNQVALNSQKKIFLLWIILFFIVDKMHILSVDKIKSEKEEFKVVMKDDKYKKKEDYIMNDIGISWAHVCNLGFYVVLDLEQAYNKEELVTDIKDGINE